MTTESYRVGDDGESVIRELLVGSTRFASVIADGADTEYPDAWDRWWRAYLRGSRPRFVGEPTRELSVVDLFCGCGGLSLGVREAALAVGLKPGIASGVDIDGDALSVFSRNLLPSSTSWLDLATAAEYQVSGWGLDARFSYPPKLLDAKLKSLENRVDVVVAGPPCEGHSNLNNRTRRVDPRNLLYLDAVAVAVALDATAVMIENVPDVANDSRQVLDTAIGLMRSAGYRTSHAVLGADRLGMPQTRRRLFLVASRRELQDLQEVRASLARTARSVRWAIGDLVGGSGDQMMDAVPALSSANKERIDYLFDHGVYDLPNDVRPESHRNGHSYPSVYGRLRWDATAGTITTGFMTPGRGRFVHPGERRPLTPREAARLQGFPDWFDFRPSPEVDATKSSLAKWIGDSVPPMMAYAASFAFLRSFLPDC